MAQGGVSVGAEEIFALSKEALDITLLGSEWNSSAGGLSTLNREFAIHLSQQSNVRVSMLVPEGACKDEDKKAAQNFGITVLDARQRPGFINPLDWLYFPPQDHKINVVVGHGVKLGRQVQLIKNYPQFQNCKWVHMVHTAPEDLSKYKGYDNPTSRGEQKHWDEVDLCKYADLVVPVGPRLKKAYSSYLQGCKKVEDIFEIVPGLFDREFGDLVQQAKVESDDDFKVLLCGRGDEEDFELKGYDIAVKAFADQRLKGKHYYLLFVGAPDGKQDEVRRRLLNCGITDEQLTVRKFVQSRSRMRDLFSEVDLVIMPSKSEGFGLVALEALSASLPVLVGSNSGFARAIKSIPFGTYSIVDSNDPGRWAEAIEGVRVRHRVCLEESKLLREAYGREYCWKRQCEALVDKLWSMVHESSTCQASAAESSVEEQPSAIPGAFCQADTTTMQQHAVQKGALTSYRKNAKKSSQGKTSKSNSEEGINENEIRQRSKPQQLPPVRKYKKSKTKEKDKKVSGTPACREERSLCAFGVYPVEPGEKDREDMELDSSSGEDLDDDQVEHASFNTVQKKVKEGNPPNDVLEELSQAIGEKWKPLARRLKFTETDITRFHKQNEEYTEKPYKMLLEWKQRKGSQSATYKVLFDALCHHLVGRQDLAEKFCCC